MDREEKLEAAYQILIKALIDAHAMIDREMDAKEARAILDREHWDESLDMEYDEVHPDELEDDEPSGTGITDHDFLGKEHYR